MKKWIKKYQQLNPQPKAAISAFISVLFNFILGISKFIFAIFKGVFFFVSGVINIFFALAKLECFWGLKNYRNESFKYRNIKVAIFLLIAGIQYTIYMLTLVFGRRNVMQYSDFLSINIALIAFVELGIAIYGIFKIKGKDHYYRDIKFINLCTALTSLMWAELALLSFTTGNENMFACGISGMVVGIVIILIAVYIYFAPKVSLIDQEHNIYKANTHQTTLNLNNNTFKLILSKSKIFGDYIYIATYENNIIDGHITKTKNHWNRLNIIWKILIIVLSEILIFAYAILGIIYFFKNINLIKKLDNQMSNLGFKKIKK